MVIISLRFTTLTFGSSTFAFVVKCLRQAEIEKLETEILRAHAEIAAGREWQIQILTYKEVLFLLARWSDLTGFETAQVMASIRGVFAELLEAEDGIALMNYISLVEHQFSSEERVMLALNACVADVFAVGLAGGKNSCDDGFWNLIVLTLVDRSWGRSLLADALLQPVEACANLAVLIQIAEWNDYVRRRVEESLADRGVKYAQVRSKLLSE